MTKPSLADSIRKEYRKLASCYADIPPAERLEKSIAFNKMMVSPSDLIAYQIGWGNFLIHWYEAGIKGENPQMPGDGFTTWDYPRIAMHFFNKYAHQQGFQQERVFQETAEQIAVIAEKESQTGHLEKRGVWPWCTLKSGVKWPLCKWIRVNSVAPYKRASNLLSKKLG